MIIWEAFKERLSTSEFNHIYFDLGSLIHRDDDLEDLAAPFSKEEIDNIVQNLPLGKSPGPDGFNTDFKCWTVIAQDFYDLCDAFYENNLCIQSINDSYITLIPKIDNPFKVSDYRPISLLNSSIKVLTKLLANRL
jgi:hypothetical protein